MKILAWLTLLALLSTSLHAAQVDIVIDKHYLHFPVSNKAGQEHRQRVEMLVDGGVVREFDIRMAERPDWYAHLDVSEWQGKTATLRVGKLAADSKLLGLVRQADTIWNPEQLYREALRPQLRFSARRGWINDPNGMVWAGGEYHLYFQTNPYGCGSGNKHWGHAVSPDLVHWQEQPIALYPHKFGDWAYSGGAVVDQGNTSGWRQGTHPLLVATYTSTARGECVVYSNDCGRTFQEYDANPVIKHHGRDPRPLWYAPDKHWVIALYDEFQGEKYIAFHTSPDLKTWTFASRIAGFFECADLFEMPVDSDLANKKWVLTAASSEYMVGTFDGRKFSPETPKLPGHRGRGFYAAQTFSNEPHGRVVQIGWLKAASPGMPFNQAMSLPLELKLRGSADGPRLTWAPVKELETLRDGTNQAAELGKFRAELIELRAEFEPGDAETIEFKLRGAILIYDTKNQELLVNALRVPAPLIDGKQRLIVYVDRTALEVFASDGLAYVPLPFIPRQEDQEVSVQVHGGNAKMNSLQIYKLQSIWK